MRREYQGEQVVCFYNLTDTPRGLGIGEAYVKLWSHYATYEGGVIRMAPFGAIWLKA